MAKHLIVFATLLLMTASAYCQGPSANEWIVEEDSSDINITTPWPADSLLMPPYPEAAARQGIEGEVVAQVFVNKRGEVKKVMLVREKPNGFGFGDFLEPTLAKWRFTPAVRDSQAVGVWIILKFTFLAKRNNSLSEPQGVPGMWINAPTKQEGSYIPRFIVVKPSDGK